MNTDFVLANIYTDLCGNDYMCAYGIMSYAHRETKSLRSVCMPLCMPYSLFYEDVLWYKSQKLSGSLLSVCRITVRPRGISNKCQSYIHLLFYNVGTWIYHLLQLCSQ